MNGSDLYTLLCVPGGRIGPSDMVRGGIFLIGLGTLLKAIQLLNAPTPLLGVAMMLNIILIVPWVFLWAKRFRDGGRSALMMIIPMGVYIVLATFLMIVGIGDVFVQAMTAGFPHQGDMAAMQEAMDVVMLENVRKLEIAALIMPIPAALIVLLGANRMIVSKRP